MLHDYAENWEALCESECLETVHKDADEVCLNDDQCARVSVRGRESELSVSHW